MINEVEMNPQDTDSGNEWAELYNPSDETVSLVGWHISYTAYCSTGEGTCWESLPSDAVIQPKSCYVYPYQKQHLNNSNGWEIHLRDSAGVIVDRTPRGLVDLDNDSHTWQRIPNGHGSWKFLPGTRGTPN